MPMLYGLRALNHECERWIVKLNIAFSEEVTVTVTIVAFSEEVTVTLTLTIVAFSEEVTVSSTGVTDLGLLL